MMARSLARWTVWATAVTMVGALCSPETAMAQQQSVGVEVKVQGSINDNFFQSPDDDAPTEVRALRVEARALFKPVARGAVTFVLGGGGTGYEGDTLTATSIFGSFVVNSRAHDLTATVGREQDRLIFDVGDGVGTADILFVVADYGVRVSGGFELKARLTLQSQSFETPEHDNTLIGVGSALRFHGFGRSFSPEIGVLFGGRSATDRGDDHDQTDYYVKVRSAPTAGIYMSFRYRHRLREYSITDSLDRNFGREDSRDQFTALAVFPANKPLAATAYFARQDATSTLPTRTFETTVLTLGLRVRF